MTRISVTSLRARLMMLVIISVVPALLLTLSNGLVFHQLTADDTRREMLQLARLAASEQDLLVEGTRQLLVVLAQLPAVRGRDEAACNTLFGRLRESYPMYSNIGAATLGGDVWCSALPIIQPVSVADRKWFITVVGTRDFAIGAFQVGRITGEPNINFGYPVLDETGEENAVVYTALDLGWLNRRIAETSSMPEATVTVMDADGAILARFPGSEIWWGKSLPEASVAWAIQNESEGTVETAGADGATLLYAFRAVKGARAGGLHVSVSKPAGQAFADVDRTLTRGLAGLALVTVFALAAAWLGGGAFVLRPIKSLLGTTQRLMTGDLSARTGLQYGEGELGQLARALDEMAVELEQSGAQLRLLLAKSVSIQSEERARIGRDMHDGVLQLLTAARIELRAAKVSVESASLDVAQQRLSAAREVMDEMEGEIRQAILALHPPILEGGGLIPALSSYASSFEQSTGITCRVQIEGKRTLLPSNVEATAFRVVEEALQNVAVHARARTASVTLDYRRTLLSVTVQDDGQGFDYEQVMVSRNPEHLGLVSMRERGEGLGGRVEIWSERGRGTRVTLWLPLQSNEG